MELSLYGVSIYLWFEEGFYYYSTKDLYVPVSRHVPTYIGRGIYLQLCL
jgi:hypothetical protein